MDCGLVEGGLATGGGAIDGRNDDETELDDVDVERVYKKKTIASFRDKRGCEGCKY